MSLQKHEFAANNNHHHRRPARLFLGCGIYLFTLRRNRNGQRLDFAGSDFGGLFVRCMVFLSTIQNGIMKTIKMAGALVSVAESLAKCTTCNEQIPIADLEPRWIK